MKTKRVYIFAVLIFALSGCGIGSAEKGRVPSPDWSRGAPLATGVEGSVGMAVSGGELHLVWPIPSTEGNVIHYERYDAAANLVASGDYPVEDQAVRAPRLLAGSGDNLHLVWSGREGGGRDWGLHYSLLDHNAAGLSDPVTLADTAMSVGGYRMVQDPDGGGFVFWESGRDRIFGARLDANNGVPEAVELGRGITPSGQLDEAGTLHLAWFENGIYYYDALPDGALQPVTGTAVAEPILGSGDIVTGSTLGAAGEWVYVLWSSYSQTGLEAGTGRVEYVTFRQDAPGRQPTEQLLLATTEELPYSPVESTYSISNLVIGQSGVSGSSTYAASPYAAAPRGDQLAVALSSEQALRQQVYVQVAILLFEDGEMLGYQMASKTQLLSQDPLLEADDEGNLHLVWREGARGSQLYYASTSPVAIATLNRLGAGEAISVLFTIITEMITSMLLFPLALGWMIPGAIILGVWKLRRDYESVDIPSSRVLLVIAVASYMVIKVLFLPTILTYVPFSAWTDLPTAADFPLRIALPLLIFVVAVIPAELLRRRRPPVTTVTYYLVLTTVDALLTLAVYGVAFLGVF